MKLYYVLTFLAVFVLQKTHGYVYEEEYDADMADYRIDRVMHEEKKNCTKPGLLCKDCGTLVHCLQGEEGDYDEVIVDNCAEGTTCLVNECTPNPNPNCMNTTIEFNCTSTGVFPDPFDCKTYHFCSDEGIVSGVQGITTFECIGNYGFDPVTTYCKNKLTNGCVNFPVPLCSKVGQTGPLTNKSIYYICVKNDNKYYPKLYLCPHGKIYNGTVCI